MPGIDDELPPGIELGEPEGDGVDGIEEPLPPGEPLPLGGAGVPADPPPLEESLPQPLTSTAPPMATAISDARSARALKLIVIS